MVVKSILMIIHIVSIKQEGSLSGLLYEFIPSLMDSRWSFLERQEFMEIVDEAQNTMK